MNRLTGSVHTRSLVVVLGVLGALCALQVDTRGQSPAAPAESASQRAGERLRALRREAEDLSTRGQSLLAELRTLEIERQLKTDELGRVQLDLRTTQAQLADAISRAAALREAADTERPDVEARFVRLYKMGRAGYWRLLLDVDDVRTMGRAYRTAAALTQLDGDRVRRHEQTLTALARERIALEERARQVATLQEQAATAHASIERAVSARTALVASIDERRDLTAQLADELERAQQRLQASIGQGGSGRPGTVTLPLRPFRGTIAWPADGIVLSRFGRRTGRGGIETARNGIEISLAEGRPVQAIHEGIVSFAAPFTGYGNLVIVDHGDGAHSLYGHLSTASVTKGDRVEPQARIGLSGRNPGGNPALYFELRVDGKPVDPLQWLKK
ncbi:MAG TPA: peptidoglycan DD-metalloendopeptidase family protein [Vicinamibacterales bacterium]|nr:peptidoglycan DD-metalloendopeptidase family protein [Vicinamibacterales bacterium]